jgi:arylsulfatase A-like enzyme
MGHGFGVYQELVHVPLVVRFPGQADGRRVQEPVSTLQLFHTLLDGNVEPAPTALEDAETFAARLEWLNLRAHLSGGGAQARPVFTEAFPPENLVRAVEAHKPDLIDQFKIRTPLRAAYNRHGHKLVRAEGAGDVLFDLGSDPAEQAPWPVIEADGHGRYLQNALEKFLEQARGRRPEAMRHRRAQLDDALLQRLRRLGYME